jgi:type II secretory ATPase GspE/PulE/Tfp pilus assembly ATPase PilB-like protein/FixJ family two-component response regulator
MSQHTLLFVDDEENILKSLKRLFLSDGYTILTAPSGAEGLSVLENNGSVNLVMSDYMMPGMTGTEFLKAVKEKYPEMIRIMLTGHNDISVVMEAVNQGAIYKFINKPWNADELKLNVKLALDQYDLIKKNKELTVKEKEYKKEITGLNKFAALNRSQLGRMMLKSRRITPEQLAKAEKLQQKKSCSLPRAMIELGYSEEGEINKLIKKNAGIEHINLAECTISQQVLDILPQSVCEKSIVIPVKLENRKFTIAMADPTDLSLVDDLGFATGLTIAPVIAAEREILMKFDEVYGTEHYSQEAMDVLDEYSIVDEIEVVLEDEEESLEEMLLSKDLPAAVCIVNAIISKAIVLKASDIHIEPRTQHATVRFRIDDMLQDVIQIPLKLYLPTVSRIKIMSEMDIAERRRPQDGRLAVKTTNGTVDLRISTLPTIKGEKVVIRILDRKAFIVNIADTGISSNQMEMLKKIIYKPQGIILATGPTGSGKTSTLYSLLKEISNPTKNFITIENPVEYYLENAGQVLVKEKIGLDFASILRSVLRQDPNIIMLGEIRDLETAEVTFQAALTGHLVLSTLHTNSALATISRLRYQKLASFIIASALEVIIAQRLVRKICNKCREKYSPSEEFLSYLGIDGLSDGTTFYHGTGCEACYNTGYSGRTGIFEIFVMNTELKHMISNDATEDELQKVATDNGMTTLLDDGIAKIESGITTCEEVLRVLGPKREDK